MYWGVGGGVEKQHHIREETVPYHPPPIPPPTPTFPTSETQTLGAEMSVESCDEVIWANARMPLGGVIVATLSS